MSKLTISEILLQKLAEENELCLNHLRGEPLSEGDFSFRKDRGGLRLTNSMGILSAKMATLTKMC